MEWTNSVEESLVELWEERQCLYNITDPSYSNRDKRSKAMNELADALKTTVAEVERRMKTLRTQFSKTKKLPASGSSAKKLSSRQQWMMEKLSFLLPFVSERPSKSNMPAKYETSNSQSDDSQDSTQDNHQDEAQPQPKTSQVANKSRKRKVEEEELSILQEMLTVVKSDSAPSDPDIIFGQYIASELKQIKDVTAKANVKQEIIAALFRSPRMSFVYEPAIPQTQAAAPVGSASFAGEQTFCYANL